MSHMRLYSIQLVAAAAFVACITSSSEKSRAQMVQANRPTSDRATVDDYRNVPDQRLSQATTAAEREERVPPASEALASIETMVADCLEFLQRNIHAPADQTLTTEDWLRLHQLDDHSMTRFADKLKIYHELRVWVVQKLSLGPNGLHDVVELIRIHEQPAIFDLPKILVAAGKEASTIEGIVKIFNQARADLSPLNPASLHTLRKFVNEWNVAHDKKYTLLNALVLVYGDIATLAPALSIAKKSRISGLEAMQLQDELLTILKHTCNSLDEVLTP